MEISLGFKAFEHKEIGLLLFPTYAGSRANYSLYELWIALFRWVEFLAPLHDCFA